MLSSISSLAEVPKRIKKIFKTTNLSKNVLKLKLFIRDKPTMVSIDTYLPNSGSSLIFMK